MGLQQSLQTRQWPRYLQYVHRAKRFNQRTASIRLLHGQVYLTNTSIFTLKPIRLSRDCKFKWNSIIQEMAIDGCNL